MNFPRTPAAWAAACLLVAVNAWAQPQPQPQPQAPRPAPNAAARPPLPGGVEPGARPPAPPLAARAAETTLTGRIAQWLVNPNGEVDGLLLEDGTQVNFPPHLSAGLLGAVKARDSVEITGHRSDNARVVRASMIKSTSSGRSVAEQPPEAGAAPPAPRPTAALTAMNASGRVATLLYTGRGDLKGALLQDGSAVRFPPHVGAGLADTLKPGATLYARGYGTQSPLGKTLEATAIGPTAETAREVFAPPARPPAPPAPPAPPVAPSR